MSFDFPFEPYKSQVETMNFAYRVIQASEIAVIESPTGTGKSLMMLCCANKWLKDNKPKQLPWLKKKKIDRNSFHKIIQEEVEDEWQKLLYNNENLSTTRTYTQKIIYVTRTHSQIASIVKELRKTKFGSSLKISILGSRTHYCINSKCSKLSGTYLNDACKDLVSKKSCGYLNESIDKFVDDFQSKLWDIEDIVQSGIKNNFCPYYLSKISVNEADLVIAPFQSILLDSTRKSFGLSLKNCLVIVDEAHNFYDASIQADCVSISFIDLVTLCDSFTSYKSKYIIRLKAINIKMIELAINCLVNLIKLKDMTHLSTKSLSMILSAVNLENFNFYEIGTHLERLNFHIKLKSIFLDKQLSQNSYFNFLTLLRVLMNSNKVGYITINDYLQYTKTSPHNSIQELADECQSMVFIAGTLSPLDEYINSMIPKTLLTKVKSYISPHEVDSTRFRVMTVGLDKFDNKTYNLDLLIDTTNKIINKAPPQSGILVYVASFSILDKLKSKLKNKKDHLFEPNSSTDINSILAKHQLCCKTSKSIIFAVFGGKLSEGIDFKNELCRTLILFGLPFPNMQCESFKQKCKSLNIQSEFDYGLSITMRSINQTIGRCLRHHQDFAYCFLIDTRYNSYTNTTSYLQSIMNQFSKWIKPHIFHSKTLDLIDYNDFFINRQ